MTWQTKIPVAKCVSKNTRRRQRTLAGLPRQAVCVAEPLEGRLLLSKTIYVDVNSPAPARNGPTWATAYTDLQAALGVAVSGDTIKVADGTYRPTAGTDRTISFTLKTGVALYGGYAGNGSVDPDARDVVASPSILSGDIGTVGSDADNSYHVVVGGGTDSTAVLDGFTVAAGNASYSTGSNSTGGGMYCSGGSPTLVNCIFTRNRASSGGGMYNAGDYNLSTCAPTLINCAFRVNTAWEGGAIYNYRAMATVADCTFIGNSASGAGGGMYNYGPLPTITNCTFTGNTAVNGGGVYDNSVASNFTNCILWGNSAGLGPQVCEASGSIIASYCDIQGLTTGTGNISLDPRFMRNASFGPDGTWGTADDDYGDLRLRLTSPAIDAGKNAAVPGGLTTDLAGSPRFQEIAVAANTGTGATPIVDMGAYEAVAALQAVAGGPYYVVEGSTEGLAGAGYSDTGLAVSYAWDLDGDGTFDDGFIAAPAFSAAGIQGPQSVTVTLRVTDSLGVSVIDTASVVVLHPLYVDDTAPGANNGTSWLNAYTSLQSALVAATAGQTICVGQGTYKPTMGTDRNARFQMKSGVRLLGGYVGQGVPDPYLRNVGLYATVLSGDIGAGGVKADNSYSVIVSVNTNASAVLDGFLVTGANGASINGGGMANDRGNPTIVNCTFTANSANGGGGIANYSSSPTLINCTFIGNSASTYGGGIFSDGSSSPTLTNCTFIANRATDGGGVCSSPGASLTNCLFIANSATNRGGGAVNSEATSLLNCSFIANTAAYGGGVYNYNYFSINITNCTFSANSATAQGGAVFNPYWPALVNCIIWGNAAPSGGQIYQVTGTTIITHSDIEGGLAGKGNISADPQFVRSPSSGADGKWGTTDDDYGDLRLQITSACIDAGNNAAVPPGIVTDLGGHARFIDIPSRPDTGAGTAPLVDMGAYERGLVVTTTGTSANEQFSVGLAADKATLQIWKNSSLLAGPVTSYAVNTVESCEFVAGGGDDMLTVDVSNGLPGIGLTFTGGDGKDALLLTGTTSEQSVQVLPGQVVVGTVAILNAGVEGVQLDGPAGGLVDVGSLTVGTNLAVTAGKNMVLRAGSLSIGTGGTLDLAGNGMILNYGGSSPMATVNQWLSNGRMGITPALMTSGNVATGTAALGLVDNALIHLGSFAGQSLGGVFSQLLIQQTVAGDANLDGVVDDSDYLAVIANMGRTDGQWFLGDLNGDGVVTADDLTEVSAHLGNTVLGASMSLPIVAAKTKAQPAATAKAVAKTPVKAAKPVVHPKKLAPPHNQPKVIRPATKST